MQYKHAPAMINKRLSAYYDFFVKIVFVGKTLQLKTLSIITLNQGQKLLDIGCGTGTFVCLVKNKFPNAIVFALDPDDVVLSIAQKKASQKNASIQFVKARAEKLPFPDNTFSVVTSSLAFHHMPLRVKNEALSEIRRVLKPSGSFFLIDIGKPKNIFWKIIYSIESIVEPKEYIKDNFEGIIPGLMRKTGFIVIEARKPYLGIHFWKGK